MYGFEVLRHWHRVRILSHCDLHRTDFPIDHGVELLQEWVPQYNR